MSDPIACVVLPGQGTTIQGPAGGPLTFKVRAEDTGGMLTALENEIAPGDGPPLHVHDAQDEAWLVLEGDLRFQLGEEISDAPSGTFVFVPRGVAHCFVSAGSAPARILVLFTPAGMEPFFDRFAALPTDAIVPAAFAELGAEVGMRVVGPPLR
ncbi:MAG: cupin domain-containing protein [Solirubrobacteraceae bacterium]|nr:cupin domain-containing protein [Solirubrobacteraceae bacterium]